MLFCWCHFKDRNLYYICNIFLKNIIFDILLVSLKKISIVFLRYQSTKYLLFISLILIKIKIILIKITQKLLFVIYTN